MNLRGALVAPDGTMARALLIVFRTHRTSYFSNRRLRAAEPLHQGRYFAGLTGHTTKGETTCQHFRCRANGPRSSEFASRCSPQSALPRRPICLASRPSSSSILRTAASIISTACFRAPTASPTRPGSRRPNVITMVGSCPICAFGTVRESPTRVFRNLPNAPFRIDAPPVGLSADQVLLSPIHAYYHNIEQINGGRNDMFAAMSTVGGYTMGYFDGSQMKLWQWAKEYTLADNFFMGAFGGSYLNHQYLICACTPVFKDAPRVDACAARCAGQAQEKAGLALRTRRRGANLHGRLGRPDHAGWLFRQHHAATLSAERHSSGRWGRIGTGGRQGQRTPWAAACRRKRTGPSATRYRPRESAGRGIRAAGRRPSPMARARPARNEA